MALVWLILAIALCGVVVILPIWLMERDSDRGRALSDMEEILSERWKFTDHVKQAKALLEMRGHLLPKKKRQALEVWVAEKEIGL